MLFFETTKLFLILFQKLVKYSTFESYDSNKKCPDSYYTIRTND